MTVRPLFTPIQAATQGTFDGNAFANRFVLEAAGHSLLPDADEELARIFEHHLEECCAILKEAGTSEHILVIYALSCTLSVKPRLKIHEAMVGISAPATTRS